jgi:hypothetical protein
MFAKRRLAALLMALSFVGVACGSDSGVSPIPDPDPDPTGDPADIADLPGSYSATTFTVDFGAGPIDMIDAGGSILLALQVGGATAGSLVAPGGGEGGGDFTAPLDGTWSYDSPFVTLDHTADTFLRDMSLRATDSSGTIYLWGEETFGSETIRVILRRTP